MAKDLYFQMIKLQMSAQQFTLTKWKRETKLVQDLRALLNI